MINVNRKMGMFKKKFWKLKIELEMLVIVSSIDRK
jgi:hypothetical protein